MKVTISVELTAALLDAIDVRKLDLSEVLEAAAWAYLGRGDLALLNAHADALNAEQADVLRYQTLGGPIQGDA